MLRFIHIAGQLCFFHFICCILFCCVNTSLFIHSPVGGHSDGLLDFTFVNDVALNIFVCVSCVHGAIFLSYVLFGVEFLSHRVYKLPAIDYQG